MIDKRCTNRERGRYLGSDCQKPKENEYDLSILLAYA